jgi:hypothetical protein
LSTAQVVHTFLQEMGCPRRLARRGLSSENPSRVDNYNKCTSQCGWTTSCPSWVRLKGEALITKWVGLHFERFFSQTHLVTLLAILGWLPACNASLNGAESFFSSIAPDWLRLGL